MKLHTKLILVLASGLVAVVSLSQIMQYLLTAQKLDDLFEEDLNLLMEQEEEGARNIFHVLTSAAADPLRQGEMERFATLLEEQTAVEGVQEFSLFDREGKVAASSDASNLERKWPEDLKERILAESGEIVCRNEASIEIYQSLVVAGDCVRCHSSWQEGALCGAYYLRFSTEAVTQARARAAAAVECARSAALRNGMLAALGMAVVMVAGFYFLIRRLLGRPLSRFAEVLKKLEADRVDLTHSLQLESNDEIGRLAGSFNDFIEKLNLVIADAQKIGTAVGNGAQMQAARLEHAAASTQEIAASSKDNADSSQEADLLITAVSQNIRKANKSMQAVTKAMEEVTRASNETASIVQTIDSIASQTNLLALNAAVEAARAGDAGAGFAVVAEAVRTLARQSADAARHIGELLEDTKHKVNDGTERVKKTGELFDMVARESQKVTELVQQITRSSQEQAENIESINASLGEMDENTHMNAVQADELSRTMSKFKTDAGGDIEEADAPSGSTPLSNAPPVTEEAVPSF